MPLLSYKIPTKYEKNSNSLFLFLNSCSYFFLLSFQCEPGLGASVMYNLLYNKPQKLMLLAGCSTVCTTVAEAAKMWNLIVVRFRFCSCRSIALPFNLQSSAFSWIYYEFVFLDNRIYLEFRCE